LRPHHPIPRPGGATGRAKQRTVVLIHIKAKTLAPMATAPAVPPRTALAEALRMISPKDSCSVSSFFLGAAAPAGAGAGAGAGALADGALMVGD
jgi:hypothetical protein